MTDSPPTVRPALETLRELDGKEFLEKLAIAIHDATVAVEQQRKSAKITITMDFATLSKTALTEPAITIEADINTKLPKPDANKSLFFIDSNGNPTTTQQRQRDLDLHIANRVERGEIAG